MDIDTYVYLLCICMYMYYICLTGRFGVELHHLKCKMRNISCHRVPGAACSVFSSGEQGADNAYLNLPLYGVHSGPMDRRRKSSDINKIREKSGVQR